MWKGTVEFLTPPTPKDKVFFSNVAFSKMKPLWLKLMGEQSEEAAPKHVLLQQQQLAVCKQVEWEKNGEN